MWFGLLTTLTHCTDDNDANRECEANFEIIDEYSSCYNHKEYKCNYSDINWCYFDLDDNCCDIYIDTIKIIKL